MWANKKTIPTGRAPCVAYSPRNSVIWSSPDTEHSTCQSRYLSPNTPAREATPFPHSFLAHTSPHQFPLLLPLPSLTHVPLQTGAALHPQPTLPLNSLIPPSAARPGLSRLPLLFLTAPKKLLNIHFSLLFQAVLKINFKIFLLDPVI